MHAAGEVRLYERKGSYIPRVAAVHDLCGYGKCSLGIAIPVLSAGGCDVCPVPTSLFSAHTRYPVFTMHDTTSILKDYLEAWKQEGVDIDAVYSGFLGAPEQVERIKDLYGTYSHAIRIVDPVMGDNGEIYPTYTPELCDAMGELAAEADILTPNLTEASIITGIPYEGQAISDEKVAELLDALIARGAKYVVLKGIQRGDGTIRNYIKGKDCEFAETHNELLPFLLHGTGDLYCSCLAAGIMAGHDLLSSVAFAGDFVHDAMIVSSKQPEFRLRGVSFELLLSRVADLLKDPAI